MKKHPIPKKPNEKIVKINTPVKRGTKRKHPEDEAVNIHSGVPFPSRPKPASKTRTLKDRKKGSVSIPICGHRSKNFKTPFFKRY